MGQIDHTHAVISLTQDPMRLQQAGKMFLFQPAYPLLLPLFFTDLDALLLLLQMLNKLMIVPAVFYRLMDGLPGQMPAALRKQDAVILLHPQIAFLRQCLQRYGHRGLRHIHLPGDVGPAHRSLHLQGEDRPQVFFCFLFAHLSLPIRP